nr:uncharacterized protein LOC127345486 isoform X3 [Lolium perenne]
MHVAATLAYSLVCLHKSKLCNHISATKPRNNVFGRYKFVMSTPFISIWLICCRILAQLILLLIFVRVEIQERRQCSKNQVELGMCLTPRYTMKCRATPHVVVFRVGLTSTMTSTSCLVELM